MNKFLLWLMVFFSGTAFGQTVLDGDKVTRVGAPRNYVKNPDARQNIANVTTSNTTVTRSTTTPVGEMGTEFSVNITSANGTATWALNAFSEGLKGSQCEARFRYRGANSTTRFQVVQGANVVAQITPTVDTVNSTLGSIPFPCGDLSAATTFRATNTATVSGLELADIYVGQVQAFGDAANIGPWSIVPSYAAISNGGGGTQTNQIEMARSLDSAFFRGSYNATVAGSGTGNIFTFTLPAGMTIDTAKISNTSTLYPNVGSGFVIGGTTGTRLVFGARVAPGSTNTIFFPVHGLTRNLSSADIEANATVSFNISVPISGFASSNSAVTPGSQNVWGALRFQSNSGDAAVSSATWANLGGGAFASPTAFGSATAASASCGGANNVAICMQNLSAGFYRVTYQGGLLANGTNTNCNFSLTDGTSRVGGADARGGSTVQELVSSVEGVFQITSFQTQLAFNLQAVRTAGSGDCRTGADTAANAEARPGFIVTRLDSANTQPVFIQSPVKAAGTGVAPLAGEVDHQIFESSPSSVTPTGSGVSFNIMSRLLPQGIWDCSARTAYQFGTVTGLTFFLSEISETSNSVSTNYDIDFASSGQTEAAYPNTRKIITAPSGGKTIYLVGQASYTDVGTFSAFAGRNQINCTRMNDR
jgi:hypothetical protein